MISRIVVALAAPLLATSLALIPHSASAALLTGNPWDGLVDAAARRLLTADPVAAAKWHSHQPIDDPARERQVLASADAQASRLGLDRAYVRVIFHDQLDATKAVEHARFAAWTSDPASAPPAGSSLGDIRTLIDSLNRTMVERIAANTGAARSPACRADVVAAVAGAADRHRLDPVTARALLAATRDYCR